MKLKKLSKVILAVVLVVTMLASCTPINNKAHEPLTIVTGRLDYTAFYKALKEKYPEVELEFICYDGRNHSEYLSNLIKTGNLPDIFTPTVIPDEELQEKYLLDLSVYDLSSRYAVSRVQELNINGGLYLLPTCYTINGIIYNKNLFEKNGWKAPGSFEELEALAPIIKNAGYNLSVADFSLAGAGFQYLFNIANTKFLRSAEGVQWEQDFLAGKVGAKERWEPTIKYIQKWIDMGMFAAPEDSQKTPEEVFAEGNTAFYISGCNALAANETTGVNCGYIPWLTQNGTNNRYIISISRYFGLNAELDKPKNKQKLEDALKFFDFLSTEEGLNYLFENDHGISPFENINDDSNYELKQYLNSGHSAPLVYEGWEDLIVPIGEKSRDWMLGKATGNDVITLMENTLKESLQNPPKSYATVTENLTNEETAKFVGKAFMNATEADCALISLGGYYDGFINNRGVNGSLWKGEATEGILCTICPTGWSDKIPLATMTGAEINALHEKGYKHHEEAPSYPYLLVTANGKKIDENKTYKVAFAGYLKEDFKEGTIQETEIIGLDSLMEYAAKCKEINKDTVK